MSTSPGVSPSSGVPPPASPASSSSLGSPALSASVSVGGAATMKRARPRPSLMVNTHTIEEKERTRMHVEPQSARVSHSGGAPHSLHTHALLNRDHAPAPPSLRRSASGSELPLDSPIRTPRLVPVSPRTGRSSSMSTVNLLSPQSKVKAQLQLNEAIRIALARQASHSRKSRALAEREALLRREDAEAQRAHARLEEEVSATRRTYDWRALLAKPPESRDEDEVLFLLDSVMALRIEFLLGLPKEIMMTLCKHFQLEHFQPDTYVFEQGDEGVSFYVILKGSIGVHVKDDDDDDAAASARSKRGSDEKPAVGSARKKKLSIGGLASNDPVFKSGRSGPGAPKAGFVEVMTMHSGQAFGEVALLNPKAKRSASIKTKELCEFLTIDKKTYELALKDKATQERNRRETFVRSHIFFRRLASEKQNSLISSLKEKIFQRHTLILRQGDEILKEGENSSHIYFVASGTVMLRKKVYPHADGINMLNMLNRQRKVTDNNPKILSVPSLQPPTFQIRSYHTIGKKNGTHTQNEGETNTNNNNTNNTSQGNSNNSNASNIGSNQPASPSLGPAVLPRRSVGSSSRTDPSSTSNFSSLTHGFGRSGGSNLESFSQILELGRIGSGSFFAEEGIIIDTNLEERTYSAVADERCVCYALDRTAFHKSIKGNILAMLQEMSLAKKELREARIHAILTNYIHAQNFGPAIPLSLGKNPRRVTAPSSLSSSSSTPTPPSTTLSILHPPARTKPLNLRNFGVIRLAGQVPKILAEDEPDAARENRAEYGTGIEDEDEYGYDREDHQPTTHLSRRSSQSSLAQLPCDDLADDLDNGVPLSSCRSRRRRSSSSSSSSSLFLQSAQSRSIPPAQMVADAIRRRRSAERGRSEEERERSQQRSRSHSRKRQTYEHEEESKSHTGSTAFPPSTSSAASDSSSSTAPLSPSPPPPMLPSSTLHALLGKKVSSSPLAILTQQHIPLSALSALSPQPLPLQATMPTTSHAASIMHEQGHSAPLDVDAPIGIATPTISTTMHPPSLLLAPSPVITPIVTIPHVQRKKHVLIPGPAGPITDQSSNQTPSQHEQSGTTTPDGANEHEYPTLMTIITTPPLPPPLSLVIDSPSKSSSGSVSPDSALDPSESSDHASDLLDDFFTPEERLERAHAAARDAAAWKTSPKRLSVLSRVMGIGTGHGSSRVKDSETGTILSDTTLETKMIEEKGDQHKQNEMKRLHLMASLRRTPRSRSRSPSPAASPSNEANTLDTLDSVSHLNLDSHPSHTMRVSSDLDSNVSSSSPPPPFEFPASILADSAGIGGVGVTLTPLTPPMVPHPHAAAVTHTPTHTSRTAIMKRAMERLTQHNANNNPTNNSNPHTIVVGDPILAAARGSFTSRINGSFLLGSSASLLSPASLSPFVHPGRGSAKFDAPRYEPIPFADDAQQQSDANAVSEELNQHAVRKHRYVPLDGEYATQHEQQTNNFNNSHHNHNYPIIERRQSWDHTYGIDGALPPIQSQANMSLAPSGSQSERKPRPFPSDSALVTPLSGPVVRPSPFSPSRPISVSGSRPLHSLSRIGQAHWGGHTAAAVGRADQKAQFKTTQQEGNTRFVYSHTTTGSTMPTHTHTATATGTSHPAIVPSGPSLLAGSTVTAIERYLHTHLLQDHDSPFLLPGVGVGVGASTGRSARATRVHVNIRQLAQLATRENRRRTNNQTEKHTNTRTNKPNAIERAHTQPTSVSDRRRTNSFSVAALLNVDSASQPSGALIATSPPPTVPIIQQLKHQLLQPF